MSKHENGRPRKEAATQTNSPSILDLDAVERSLPPRIDPAGMDLRELEAATERRFQAVESIVDDAERRGLARVLCFRPVPAPAWATHPERLSSEAMEQIALTEQRAGDASFADGFATAARLYGRLGVAVGYAEGQRDLARGLAAGNRAFLTEHARALAKAVDPAPRPDIVSWAARNRARLREAGVIA